MSVVSMLLVIGCAAAAPNTAVLHAAPPQPPAAPQPIALPRLPAPAPAAPAGAKPVVDPGERLRIIQDIRTHGGSYGGGGLSGMLESIERLNARPTFRAIQGGNEAPPIEHLMSPADLHHPKHWPSSEQRAGLGGGRWRRTGNAAAADVLDDDQRAEIESLAAVGYLSGSQESAAPSGVARHDRARAQPGYNFYSSGDAACAVLMDMDGKPLHRWEVDFWAVWPEYPTRRDGEATRFLRRAYLQRDGGILAIFEGLGLVRCDAQSRIEWDYPGAAHHDLSVAANGDIWVLTRQAHIVPRINPVHAVLEDFVTVLSPAGAELRRFSIMEALERYERLHEVWNPLKQNRGDLFHTNTLFMLDGTLARRLPAFAAGNLLVSWPSLNVIAVVDPEAEKVVWSARGPWRWQHDPRTLPNGNLLLFDNVGPDDYSRVLELDPETLDPVWQYGDAKAQFIYSRTCSTAQRLENGNTLITESDAGRALEVTPGGETVWEFVNPARGGDAGEFIATLFNVDRIPLDFPLAWTDPATVP